ncbi:hypothetical protein HYH03_008226 [Edaphochlamys debaryana]|uniref:Defective in cullin neddylation protein n=1 Tax=Edaphochlamys debaryana TaxID=47281 RepID=A0A835Y0M1_9CHLO|nr:hypothetical protein HYH03_008226 [Edaphochlamys debaryana]|eukprot:KAG2493713.1 hypothetical protein HYH03_008226 [Edaphochlamys debaryana]
MGRQTRGSKAKTAAASKAAAKAAEAEAAAAEAEAAAEAADTAHAGEPSEDGAAAEEAPSPKGAKAGGRGARGAALKAKQTTPTKAVPSRLTKAHKDKIKQWRAEAGGSEKAALESLAAADWDVEAAVDEWFNSGAAEAAGCTGGRRAAEALFRRYAEPGQDTIHADGVMRFCEDLQVEPTDVVMLALAHRMGAAVMCEFSRAEFVGGLARLGAPSLPRLRAALPGLRAGLGAEAAFRPVYAYAYDFSLEKGKKLVPLDAACAMWRLLWGGAVPGQAWALVEEWCEFLAARHLQAGVVPRDTWMQLLDFVKTVRQDDFSNFDESSAWPYLVDEFVEHMRGRRGGQGQGDKAG